MLIPTDFVVAKDSSLLDVKYVSTKYLIVERQ